MKLLEAALGAAGIATSPGAWGVAARALLTPRVALVVVVNERPEASTRSVRVDAHTLSVPVAALGARYALVERATARVLVSTPGDAIVAAP